MHSIPTVSTYGKYSQKAKVKHKGVDAWRGKFVQITTTDHGNYKCTRGEDFEVDDSDSVKLSCKKTGQYGR